MIDFWEAFNSNRDRLNALGASGKFFPSILLASFLRPPQHHIDSVYPMEHALNVSDSIQSARVASEKWHYERCTQCQLHNAHAHAHMEHKER